MSGTAADITTGAVVVTLSNSGPSGGGGDSPAPIYLTTDAAHPVINTLTLTITNASGAAWQLAPAADGGGAEVKLSFAGLIADATVQTFAMSAVGSSVAWAADAGQDPDLGFCLTLAPQSALSVPDGGALAFSVANVVVPSPPNTPRQNAATVMLSGVSGVDPAGDGTQWVPVSLLDPPLTSNKSLADPAVAMVEVTPATVYAVTPASGGQSVNVTVALMNGGQPLESGSGANWSSNQNQPTFTLLLPFGDGPGALSTDAESVQVLVVGAQWSPALKDASGVWPTWSTTAQAVGDGGPILGTGSAGLLTFEISGISPPALPSDLGSAVTAAWLSWSGIPGYNDGSTVLLIQKQPGPQIRAFDVVQQTYLGVPGQAEVTLEWDTTGTDNAFLSDSRRSSGVSPSSYQTSGSTTVTVQTPDTFTLEAETVFASATDATARVGQNASNRITATASSVAGGLTVTAQSQNDDPRFPNSGFKPFGPTTVHVSNPQCTWTWDFSTNSCPGYTQVWVGAPLATAYSVDGAKLYWLCDSSTVPQFYWPSPSFGFDGYIVATFDSRTCALIWVQPDKQAYLKVNNALVPADNTHCSLLVSADGGMLIACNSTDGSTLRIWTRTAEWGTFQFDIVAGPYFAAAGPFGNNLVLVAGSDGFAVVQAGGSIVDELNLPDSIALQPVAYGVAPDGSRVYVAANDAEAPSTPSAIVAIDVDLQSGELSYGSIFSTYYPFPAVPEPLTVSNDGTKVYVLGLDASGAGSYVIEEIASWVFDTQASGEPVAQEPTTYYLCATDASFVPLQLCAGASPGLLFAGGLAAPKYDDAPNVWMISLGQGA